MINEMDGLSCTRIREIAQELAGYGLGIFRPHQHDDMGNIVPPRPGYIAFENALQVSFVAVEQVPLDAVAVGWRWNGNELEVCAGCCGPGAPPVQAASRTPSD